MSKPWLTDPLYGGMSPESAECSYRAWVRQGRRTLPVIDEGWTPAQKEGILRNLEAQIAELIEAEKAYAKSLADWRRRQGPKGFRCVEKRKRGLNAQ